MYRIGICDDDLAFCGELEQIIEKHFLRNGLNVQCEVFANGEELCQAMERGIHFYLIFLDIEMPGMNGVTVGKRIRKTYGQEETGIVYLSGKTSYAMELFQNRPLDFLVKPLEKETLEELLDTAKRLLSFREKRFLYQKNGEQFVQPVGEILYFKGMDREVEMVTVKGRQRFYDSLERIYQALKDYGFIKPHRSFLVAVEGVRQFRFDRIVMENQDCIPIAQSHRKEISQRLMEEMRKLP